MLNRRWKFLLAGLALLWLGACAKTAQLPKNASVGEMYQAAVIDMEDGLYPEALKMFRRIKAKYPYSEYAVLSDVRIADCHFLGSRYIEAIESYKIFMQYHPKHVETPYAAYRIGVAHLKRASKDWWFMPPAYEKDLAPVRQGVAALYDFITRYKDSEYVSDAREQLKEGRKRLGMHEMYVARFYFKRGKYRAVLGRANGILTNYRGTGFEPEAYYMAVVSHGNLGQLNEAKNTLQDFRRQFSDHTLYEKAARALQQAVVNNDNNNNKVRSGNG